MVSKKEEKSALIRRLIGWSLATLLLFGGGLYTGKQAFKAGVKLYKWQDTDTLNSTEVLDAQKGIRFGGKMTDWVVISTDGLVKDQCENCPIDNLIVNAGENFMVDAFQNITELELIDYHGIGTSAAAVAEAQTGCTTELTTQYNPDNIRCTGTAGENGSNVYQTVCTNTVDSAVTIEEFCLMTQAAVPGGTMWSRILTGSISLGNGDSLQTTYEVTVE